MFGAAATLTAAPAEPGKLETALKEVPEAVKAAVLTKAETMSAATREIQASLMASMSEPAKV
jgi:hypothetical protein